MSELTDAVPYLFDRGLIARAADIQADSDTLVIVARFTPAERINGGWAGELPVTITYTRQLVGWRVMLDVTVSYRRRPDDETPVEVELVRNGDPDDAVQAFWAKAESEALKRMFAAESARRKTTVAMLTGKPAPAV